MSVKLNKKSLTVSQLNYIQICCTYFKNPVSTQKNNYKKVLLKLDISPKAIKFALDCFFCDLDPILIKYLGGKLKHSFDSNVNVDTPISFYMNIGEDILVPMAVGNIITGKNNNFLLNYPSRDFNFTAELKDEQKEIVPIFIDHLKKTGSTTVCLYPGAGKTYIGSYLSSHFKHLTIIFIHLSTLLKQWISTFEKSTDAKLWIVGEKQPEYFDVIICMEERLVHIPENILKQIGTIIIDEAHCFCVPSRIPCWLLQPKYLILLTATLKRPDDMMERMAYASAGNWNVTIKSKKPFNVYPIFTGIEAPIEKNSRGADWGKLVKYLLFNDERNKLILDIVYNRLLNNKFLIVSTMISHVDCLTDLCKNKNLSVASYRGTDKSYVDSQILIGTVPKIGTGFDEAAFCESFDGKRINIMILCMTIKKLTTFEQTIGRVLRAECPDVYILIDDNNINKNHWSILKWWFLNYTEAKIIDNVVITPSVQIQIKSKN